MAARAVGIRAGGGGGGGVFASVSGELIVNFGGSRCLLIRSFGGWRGIGSCAGGVLGCSCGASVGIGGRLDLLVG